MLHYFGNSSFFFPWRYCYRARVTEFELQ